MTSHLPTLSVLDLVPVSTGQSSRDAIAASLTLAEHADELGYARYWFAEHHNTPAGASSTPAVTIAAAVGRTRRIRLGSGGVMLPNHSPLIVAEQFAALEALAPGRIDLGIGRAPGSDPVISRLLTAGDRADRFPAETRDLVRLLDAGGAVLPTADGGEYTIRATPAATTRPSVWMLGSSPHSASLAATLGLPYVFASHFGASGIDEVLDLYRDGYRPSEAHPDPQIVLTANVVTADSTEEVERLALPQLRLIAGMRLGRPAAPLDTVEQALASPAADPDSPEGRMIASMRRTWFGGDGEEVAQLIAEFAARHGVDEVMLHPLAGRHDGDPLDRAPGREATLAAIAEALDRAVEDRMPVAISGR